MYGGVFVCEGGEMCKGDVCVDGWDVCRVASGGSLRGQTNVSNDLKGWKKVQQS